MNDSRIGRVYKITSIMGDEVYIGGTIQALNRRYTGHKSGYASYINGKSKFVASYILFDKYGIDNCSIELIEEIPYENLKIRETYYIDSISNINRIRSYVTYDDLRKHNREYREKHNEEISIKAKERYKDNRDEILLQKKEYHQTNKENILTKKRLYHEENRDILLLRMNNDYRDKGSVKITCDCGTICVTKYMPIHLKTQKHNKYIESLGK